MSAHEVLIALSCGTSSFRQCPNDERLSSSHIAGDENTVHIRLEFTELSRDIGSSVTVEFQRGRNRILRSEEAHRENNKIRVDRLSGRIDRHRDHAAGLFVLLPGHLYDLKFLDVALAVADELFGRHEILSRIVAVDCCDFFLAVVDFLDERILRPRVIRGTCLRKRSHDLKLSNALCALTCRGRGAVRTGITASDDDDVLALCGDRKIRSRTFLIEVILREKRLCICSQVIDRKVDALQISSFDNEVSRLGRATAQNYRVKRAPDLFYGDVLPDFNTALELHAFFFHQFDTTEDDLLIKFHVRDTVHEKSARTVRSFENGDAVSRVIELIRAGKS